MSFLSRYGLRFVLIFLTVLIIGSISSVSYLSVTLDNNIRTINDSSNEFGDLDQSIIDQIRDTTLDIDRVVRDELIKNIGTLVGSNIVDIQNNVTEIVEEIDNTIDLLKQRKQMNYEIEGINYGLFNISTAFVSIPDTSSIIGIADQSPSSTILRAKERITRSAASTSDSLEKVIGDLDDIRATYNVYLNQISSDLSTFNNQFSVMADFLDSIINKATQLANQTEAIEVIEAIHHVHEQFHDIYSLYTEMAIEFQSNPIEFDSQTYSNEMSALADNIFSEVDDFIAQQNVTLFSEITQFRFEFNTSLIPIFINNLGSFTSLQQEYDDIISQQGIILDNIRRDALNSLNVTLNLVKSQSLVFSSKINDAVDRMNSRRQLLTTNMFLILNFVVLLGLGYVVWIITRSIGRITSKNVQFAQGNLSMRLQERYANNEMGRLEESVDTTIREMRAIISSVTQTSETLAGISEELAAGAEEASASINEVSSTVREFSSGSSEQNIMLNRVRNELLDHLDVVESTANQIDETAKFVLQVAKRTNILGLNASIEAAKAGRFGLGFNVVAEEVRNLSDETRGSAARIAGSIEQIEVNIRQTVEEILTEVNIIREVAENTAAGSEEASAATSEQVSMMNEISQTSAQLSELSQTLNSLLHRFTV